MINTNLTNYLQYKEKENQITIYKIIIIYYNVKLAANPGGAFFPDHFLFLNARNVGSFLILLPRIFQRKLLLKDSDSSPKLVLLIVGNLQLLIRPLK